MDLSDYLDSTSLLSCTGAVTHKLTLLTDGKVEVTMTNVTALIDPTSRTVLRPRGFHVPDDVMNAAATLARTRLH